MLVILAIWRHVVKRFPLTYDPLYWGAVFPLAMYTTSTHRLAGALGMPALLALPHVFMWIALAAWAATFTGMVVHVVRVMRQRSEAGEAPVENLEPA
jgi:tellurite resistance protein TehA-like permease